MSAPKADNVENNEQESLLERKIREVELIKEVSTQVNKTLDITLIANTMLGLMDEHFGFKHSMILILDDSKEHLNVLATYGYCLLYTSDAADDLL